MNQLRYHPLLWGAVFLASVPAAQAQQAPQIGYIYPAGGQRGAVFEVAVGGQFLGGVAGVHVSGDGVQAAVVEHKKPLTQKQINELRQKLQQARKKFQEAQRKGGGRGQPGDAKTFAKIAEELGVSAEELKELNELRKKLTDPKRQPNPQIAETAVLRVTLASDAEPGARDVRLVTPSGMTNPLRFFVGQLPEHCENEPNDSVPDIGIQESLPLTLNGQIMPGDVDRFRIRAVKGARLVVAASARELIPYLADAVPGWFQATLTLYDSKGNEVAYADDYRFHPDPVLFCEIPEDGGYVLEIKDAIYRGREDFVYRVTLGALPFVTSVFPLGCRHGDQPKVDVTGWNLPTEAPNLDATHRVAGIHPISVHDDQRMSNRVLFAVDTLPEQVEQEPNNTAASPQRIELPMIVNGRIDEPGDWDIFCFEARAGDEIVAEVRARRLNSPLDSLLELTDADGRRLAVSDDHEDKGAGLITHQADSRIGLTLPADGVYYVRLGDTQRRGGSAFAYRLRMSSPRPDYELRVVPSTVNARAGATVPISVHALRRDGFDGDIVLQLKDAPPGYALSGGWVPAGQDRMRLTLTVPSVAPDSPVSLTLEGQATIARREVRRRAVPAEDMMQAFIYRHLVPAQQWMVSVDGRGRFRTKVTLVGDTPVKLPVGGSARVLYSVPTAPLLNQVQLALNDPPEGIAIEKVSPGPRGVAIQLRVDPEKVEPGLKGNLIVDAFTQRPIYRNGKPQAAKRRVPLGSLPAIPFEIVAAE